MCKLTYDQFWDEVERLCTSTPQTQHEKDLEGLISHMWVHSGYENCGYRKMTSEQQNLYKQTIKNETNIDT